MQVKSLRFDDKITLYWDKNSAEQGLVYRIYVNGAEQGETQKTHYTVKNLTPETAYRIELAEARGLLWQETVQTAAYPRIINVTRAPYFAKGDGVSDNTAALQHAIDDCPAGGRVYFPKGIYLSGALELHSDMELYLEENAVLQGMTDPTAYLPMQKGRFEGKETECYRSLINIGTWNEARMPKTKNITLRGEGCIRGGGKALGDNIIAHELATHNLSDTDENRRDAARKRGRLIQMLCAENITVSGLTLGYSPAWNVHMIYSRHIVTHGCKFFSEGIENGDGWNPDSSVDCALFDSSFHVGDDCIAVKSGKNPEGNRIARPTREVRIFDCISTMGHGIAVGSELSGGIEDIRIWDCDFEKCEFGVHLKTTRKRGGYVRGVYVNNCVLSHLTLETVGYNDDGESAAALTDLAHIHVKNSYITGLTYFEKEPPKEMVPVAITGTQDYRLSDLVLENVTLRDNGLLNMAALCEIPGVTVKNGKETEA